MRRFLFTFLLFLCFSAGALSAASLRPAWDGLPSETAFAVRIPDGDAFYRALKDTRVGTHLFSEERIGELLEVLEAEIGEDWVNFRRDLSEFRLEPEELPRLLRGETGLALVVEGLQDRERGRMYVLVWAEPGEDLGRRALDAILSAIEEQESEHPARRVDFQLAGRQVTHLASPQVYRDAEGRELVTHNAHTLLSLDGDRLFGALTLMSGPDFELIVNALEGNTAGLPEPEAEPSEEMLGLYARFLRAQEGAPGEFVREVSATPGLREALPAGVPWVEIAMDMERVTELVISEADDIDLRGIFDALGITGVGKVAFRGAVDQAVLRWGGLVSAPSPRRGVVETLLNQRQVPARPAAWVPATVVDYTQLALDLGALYERIRDVAIEIGGDEVANNLRLFETQIGSMIQTDPVTLLSSFGSLHTAVTLPVKDDFDPLDMEDAAAFGGPGSRMAGVWQLRDEGVWQQLMQTIGMFAPMMGGMLQEAEEQGFNGWRMEQEGVESGLFLGRGHLVFGMGPGTVEEILSALRNPPEGEASLLGSEKFREAQRLVNLQPSMYWDLQDVGKQIGDVSRLFSRQIEAGFFDGGEMPNSTTNDFFMRLLDPEVLSEAFGIGVNQVFATRDGLVVESGQYLAPAEE